MQLNVAKEVAALKRLTMRELHAKHAELFGAATASGNRAGLVKRLIWRMQALAEGDLSERAAELANDADLRVVPRRPARPSRPRPAHVPGCAQWPTDKTGLPKPGTVLTRTYEGERASKSACWPTASSSRARSTPPSPPSPRRSAVLRPQGERR